MNDYLFQIQLYPGQWPFPIFARSIQLHILYFSPSCQLVCFSCFYDILKQRDKSIKLSVLIMVFGGVTNQISVTDRKKALTPIWSKTLKEIISKLNPPSTTWWNSCRERFTRVINEIFRCSSGDLEGITNDFCGCKATTKPRHLTYYSQNLEDMVPQTSSMFLILTSTSTIIDIDEVRPNTFHKSMGYRYYLLDQLTKIFRTDNWITSAKNSSNLPVIQHKAGCAYVDRRRSSKMFELAVKQSYISGSKKTWKH